jgi:GNAT superfamily N-acetyltransferase
MSVRPATEFDQSTLLQLCGALLEELCVGRGGKELRGDLSELFGCESAVLPTRMADVATTGWVSESVDTHGIGFWFSGVGLIYVVPGSRQRGFGRALYNAIRTDHAVIDFWVRPGDRAAKSFGEALGLKARKLVMNESQAEDDEA